MQNKDVTCEVPECNNVATLTISQVDLCKDHKNWDGVIHDTQTQKV